MSLTLLPDIRRSAEQIAFNDHRSLSSLVEQCLSKEIERATGGSNSPPPAS